MQRDKTLRNQRDFVLVYNKGKSQGSRYLIVLYRKNRKDFSRVAFIASKKVGNSVSRNRARRLMRAAYSELEPTVVQGYDILFVARNGIDKVKEIEVQKSMKNALSKAALLCKEPKS